MHLNYSITIIHDLMIFNKINYCEIHNIKMIKTTLRRLIIFCYFINVNSTRKRNGLKVKTEFNLPRQEQQELGSSS